MTDQALDEIRRYWDDKARGSVPAQPDLTMKDIVLRQLETESILSQLKERPGGIVCDIGCGNGISTRSFAQHAAMIFGIDSSAEMIRVCRAAPESACTPAPKFVTGDVLSLSAKYNSYFDVVISERCLINLPEAGSQFQAIAEIQRALKSGGTFLMLEGISENFARVNAARKRLGLPEISLNWHNHLFERASLESFLKEHFEIEKVVDFGAYYFLSRIFHPLYSDPEEPKFDSRINMIASKINIGLSDNVLQEFSINLLYVLNKR